MENVSVEEKKPVVKRAVSKPDFIWHPNIVIQSESIIDVLRGSMHDWNSKSVIFKWLPTGEYVFAKRKTELVVIVDGKRVRASKTKLVLVGRMTDTGEWLLPEREHKIVLDALDAIANKTQEEQPIE